MIQTGNKRNGFRARRNQSTQQRCPCRAQQHITQTHRSTRSRATQIRTMPKKQRAHQRAKQGRRQQTPQNMIRFVLRDSPHVPRDRNHEGQQVQRSRNVKVARSIKKTEPATSEQQIVIQSGHGGKIARSTDKQHAVGSSTPNSARRSVSGSTDNAVPAEKTEREPDQRLSAFSCSSAKRVGRCGSKRPWGNRQITTLRKLPS